MSCKGASEPEGKMMLSGLWLAWDCLDLRLETLLKIMAQKDPSLPHCSPPSGCFLKRALAIESDRPQPLKADSAVSELCNPGKGTPCRSEPQFLHLDNGYMTSTHTLQMDIIHENLAQERFSIDVLSTPTRL